MMKIGVIFDAKAIDMFITLLDVGMEKEQKHGGYLYYPFLHSTTVSHYVLHVHNVQWNAGMGNTDTLHPNSCFCSFSIPTSKIF